MANRREELTKVRLDKWLWAARFFKTRALSSEAIAGGKIHLNGQRVKPAKMVSAGDKLTVTRGEDTFHIEVLGVNDKRRPAKEAQLLYLEDEVAQKARLEQAETRRLEKRGYEAGRRPDKRQRRQIRRFKDQ